MDISAVFLSWKSRFPMKNGILPYGATQSWYGRWSKAKITTHTQTHTHNTHISHTSHVCPSIYHVIVRFIKRFHRYFRNTYKVPWTNLNIFHSLWKTKQNMKQYNYTTSREKILKNAWVRLRLVGLLWQSMIRMTEYSMAGKLAVHGTVKKIIDVNKQLVRDEWC